MSRSRHAPLNTLAALAAAALAAAASPAFAQCEGGSWSDTFPAPAYLHGSTIRQAVMLDPDGHGPEPARLTLLGDGIRGSGMFSGTFDPTADLQVWNGSELLPIPAERKLAIDVQFTFSHALMFDDDGPLGPRPSSVHVIGRIWLTRSTGTVQQYVAVRHSGEDWEPLPFPSGVYYDSVVFDDDADGPNSPALFVAKSSGIVRWDGATASIMTQPGAPGTCFTLLTCDPDGPGPLPFGLVAGGVVPGLEGWHVSLWNGTEWTRLPGQFNSVPRAASTFDPDGDAGPEHRRLAVAGNFTSVDGVPIERVAHWLNGQWSAFGGGIGAQAVSALAEFDGDGDGPAPPRLYVGGDQLSVPGQSIAPLYAWDGIAWIDAAAEVGADLTGTVAKLAAFDPDADGPLPVAIHITGKLTLERPDAEPQYGYVRWDGANWQSLDRLIDSFVLASAALPAPTPGGPEELVIAGGFTAVAGVPTSRVAKWNGVEWAAIGAGLDGLVRSLVTHDFDGPGLAPASLVAAGTLDATGLESVLTIARWDGSEWVSIHGGLPDMRPRLCSLDRDGPAGLDGHQLYLAGVAEVDADHFVCRVYEWTSGDWNQLGSDLQVMGASATFGEVELHATVVDGQPALLLAVTGQIDFPAALGGPCRFGRWDGVQWTSLGSVEGLCAWSGAYEHGFGLSLVPGTDGVQGLDANEFLYAGTRRFDDSHSPVVYRASATSHTSAEFPQLTWSPGNQFSPMVTVGSLGRFDEDGAGPRAPYLVCGTIDWHSGAWPALFRWDGKVWTEMGDATEFSAVGQCSSVDYDGEGPQPPRLVAIHGQWLVIHFGGPSVPLAHLREWIPNVPATLIESPQSLIVRPGDPASFKVLAVGTDASIEWRKDAAPLPEGALATEHSWIIAIDSATISDRGLYDAVITNACAEVTSSPAELRVRVLEGDANADTVVDFNDITDALAHWGADYDASTGPGDADSDGTVSMSDLTATLKNWLAQE